jgi:hypothetical protein
MASVAADRDLLFGLLVLQNGLINQVRLVAAFQAWTLDRSRPLPDQLVARGDLDALRRRPDFQNLLKKPKVEVSLIGTCRSGDRPRSLRKDESS